jgi:hypothetical protein
MEIVAALPAGTVAIAQAVRAHARPGDAGPVAPAARATATILAARLAGALRPAPLALPLLPGLGARFANDEAAEMQNGAGKGQRRPAA